MKKKVKLNTIERWDRIIVSPDKDLQMIRKELEELKNEKKLLAQFVNRLISYSMILRRYISYRDSGRITDQVALTPVGPEPNSAHLDFLCSISPSACNCYLDPRTCGFDPDPQEPVPLSCDQLRIQFCGASRCLEEICQQEEWSEADYSRMIECKENLDQAWSELLSGGCINDTRIFPDLGRLRDIASRG